MPDLDRFIAPVRDAMADLYSEQTADVPFHGWHHISFVATKAKIFAEELDADAATVEIAALVHDVNYLVDAASWAARGAALRAHILKEAGLDDDAILRIEEVVTSSETRVRGRDLSREAMALSDADTLFKALPITPVVLAPLYMRETGKTLRELADKIVGEQVPLRDDGIYFYSDSAKKKYESWGETNLALWVGIRDALDDPSVLDLIEQVGQYTKISG
jgi:uncharacterized protein